MRFFRKTILSLILNSSFGGILFAAELFLSNTDNLTTSEIKPTYLYPESNHKYLNLPYIHHYNPFPISVIAFSVQEMSHVPFPEQNVDEKYLVITRPFKDPEQTLLFRPHYWVIKDLTSGDQNINVESTVVSVEGQILLPQSFYNVHVHGNICSPSNMPLNLSQEDSASYLLYSLVTLPNRKVLTCHWIPTQEQWEILWKEGEFCSKHSHDTASFFSKFGEIFLSDSYFQMIQEFVF